MDNIIRISMQYFAELEEEGNGQQNPPDTSSSESVQDGLPKTQEELNDLIEKRLARERRKQAKSNSTETSRVAGEALPVQDSALEDTQKALREANAKLAAIRAGVSASVVDDAVLLALHEAGKDGVEPDEGFIAEALTAVLKRHPEWKQEEKRQGGIRVGAGSAGQPKAEDDSLSLIFGNKKT